MSSYKGIVGLCCLETALVIVKTDIGDGTSFVVFEVCVFTSSDLQTLCWTMLLKTLTVTFFTADFLETEHIRKVCLLKSIINCMVSSRKPRIFLIFRAEKLPIGLNGY